jgi:hypothetical protein
VSAEQLELARRLVSHPKWRWVAGMRIEGELGGSTVYTIGKRVRVCHTGGNTWLLEDHEPASAQVPDLADFITAACLLRMRMEIEELYNEPAIHEGGMWAIGRVAGRDLGEVAAAALLEAWGSP